jgi:hypothetical protein
VETIYYGHVPPVRDRRTSEGCPGVVLRATRGDRNNIPYSFIAKNGHKFNIPVSPSVEERLTKIFRELLQGALYLYS